MYVKVEITVPRGDLGCEIVEQYFRVYPNDTAIKLTSADLAQLIKSRIEDFWHTSSIEE